MKPPRPFKERTGRLLSYSLCKPCDTWQHNNIFHHEGAHWILCKDCYEDYWYNTDELLSDYKGY